MKESTKEIILLSMGLVLGFAFSMVITITDFLPKNSIYRSSIVENICLPIIKSNI